MSDNNENYAVLDQPEMADYTPPQDPNGVYELTITKASISKSGEGVNFGVVISACDPKVFDGRTGTVQGVEGVEFSIYVPVVTHGDQRKMQTNYNFHRAIGVKPAVAFDPGSFVEKTFRAKVNTRPDGDGIMQTQLAFNGFIPKKS